MACVCMYNYICMCVSVICDSVPDVFQVYIPVYI